MTELYVLLNSGDRTYIGQQEVQGRRWTSSYQLPAGARDVAFEDGAWGGRFLQVEGGLVDTEPLWPGQTTVIFAYNVDCPSGLCDLGRTLHQRVSNLNVLVPDTGATVTSKTLAAQGNMEAQGRSYLNFAASDLAPATSARPAHRFGRPRALFGSGELGRRPLRSALDHPGDCGRDRVPRLSLLAAARATAGAP